MASEKKGWLAKNKLIINKEDYPNGVPFKAYVILVNHWCHRIILTIAQIALVVMLCTVFMNVVLRFCFNSGIEWAEEVPRLLVMLFTFLACAIGVRDHMHIAVDIVYNRFPKGGKMRRFMDVLSDVATLLCGIFLVYYGTMYVVRLFGRPGNLPMTGLPTWVQYIPAPLGGIVVTFDSILFLAGIKQIPTTYYEAAEIDGATKLRKFFSITLPELSPIVLFNVVMQMINAFQEFTPAYVITQGGPLRSTYLYGLMLYETGFEFFHMGYASALSWILFAIIMVFTILIFKFSELHVHYGDD